MTDTKWFDKSTGLTVVHPEMVKMAPLEDQLVSPGYIHSLTEYVYKTEMANKEWDEKSRFLLEQLGFEVE